jgi:hypothetical protein
LVQESSRAHRIAYHLAQRVERQTQHERRQRPRQRSARRGPDRASTGRIRINRTAGISGELPAKTRRRSGDQSLARAAANTRPLSKFAAVHDRSMLKFVSNVLALGSR